MKGNGRLDQLETVFHSRIEKVRVELEIDAWVEILQMIPKKR
jgi:hypothetical protein